jgi:hypothetical protein
MDDSIVWASSDRFSILLQLGLELESSSEASTSWSSPLLSVEAGHGGSVGVVGAEVSFNVSAGREVGNIDLRSRSDLTSLVYFTDFPHS